MINKLSRNTNIMLTTNTERTHQMLFTLTRTDFLYQDKEINRLIDIEYKNLADREFVKYFVKNNSRLPQHRELENVAKNI